MAPVAKVGLIVSLAGLAAGLAFVTGLVNVQTAVWLYVALPAGAVFFGLFLIARLFEHETAQYDAEQRTLLAAAERLSAGTIPRSEKACHGAADSREASLA
jgi:TRAP-type C4-dicarboxylate transport system permease small subunit